MWPEMNHKRQEKHEFAHRFLCLCNVTNKAIGVSLTYLSMLHVVSASRLLMVALNWGKLTGSDQFQKEDTDSNCMIMACVSENVLLQNDRIL